MLNNGIPQYEVLTLRGVGAFGYVIEAYDKIHDARVAIKRTHKVGNKLSREYDILNQIKDCPYVIQLLDAFYTINDEGKVNQNLVLEYVNRNLEDFLSETKMNSQKIPIEQIRKIAKELLLGLDYIHKKHIVHRDLKPENILFNESGHLKICDFGSSKIITENTISTPYIVSRYYRAPELLFGVTNYNEKIDIFSFGCIFGELFTLNALFQGKTEGMQIFELMAVIGSPKKSYLQSLNAVPDKYKNLLICLENSVSPYNLEILLDKDGFYEKEDIKLAADLLKRTIGWKPNERISAEEALNHPFFKDKSINN